ncbi:MAG: hypothetical protein ACI8QD_000333 [Cyclobacteriaceae bacterium]|jgi:hypothetical protein
MIGEVVVVMELVLLAANEGLIEGFKLNSDWQTRHFSP